MFEPLLVGVVYPTFNLPLFVLTVGITCKISDPNRS